LKSASLQYANALADVALAQGAADAALKQLGDFAAALAGSPELRNFLASPAVARDAKHGVIEKICSRVGAGKIIRNFLFVIADHQRSHILPEIVAAFQDVIRQRQGIAEAEGAHGRRGDRLRSELAHEGVGEGVILTGSVSSGENLTLGARV